MPPKGRTIAILPFTTVAKRASLIDSIKLAELTAMTLREALPDVPVLGPSTMQKAMAQGLNEGRWTEIGREVGAQLLVVGQINSIDASFDKLLQAREGTLTVQFRVLDVTATPPKALATVNWGILFPEGPGEKYDGRFVAMDDLTFRGELLKAAARRIAGVFYDHLEKRRPVSQLEVRVWTE